MKTLWLVPALFWLSGCSTVGVTRLSNAAPKSPHYSLQIFSEPAMVKRPFEEVCLLDSRTGSTAFHNKTAAGAIENAKADACRCGADAIIIGSMGSTGAGFNSWGNGTAVMKAIRFTDGN